MNFAHFNKPIIAEYCPASKAWLAHGECCGVPFVAEGATEAESIDAAIDMAAEGWIARRKSGEAA